MSASPGDQARPRLQLALILTIVVATLGGSWLLYQVAREGGLWSTTNRGTFVRPPVTAAALKVRSGGAPVETGVWWLWVLPQGPCGDGCREALHQLRQLHVLLNRDASRVRRGLITADGTLPADLRALYPRLAALSGSLEGLAPGIYVVDPLGNLVLHYPMSDAGEPVLDDLKRLLKVSQIG